MSGDPPDLTVRRFAERYASEPAFKAAADEAMGVTTTVVGRKEGDVPYDSRPDTYEHIARVRLLMLRFAFDLIERAHAHDASKLVDPERATFDEFTPKLKDTVYGSDEYRGFLRDMQPALEHHYAHNRHHPEHHEEGVDGMNLADVVEMLCDWTAASERTKDGDVRQSILNTNKERFGLSDQLARLLLNTLDDVLP